MWRSAFTPTGNVRRIKLTEKKGSAGSGASTTGYRCSGGFNLFWV